MKKAASHRRSLAAFQGQLCSLKPKQLTRESFADSLASFSQACLIVSFDLAACRCSFAMQLGNAAFSHQLAASERSFGTSLGSLEFSVAALGSLAVYLPSSLGMKLAACKADFAA